MAKNNADVVIVGAGPTGLMLAGELRLAGVDVVVLERRRDQAVDGSRAGGLHARSLEVLDQRGIAERFVAEGKPVPVMGFASALSIADFPTRFPYALGLWQSRIEPLLADWAAGLGVVFVRGCDVVSVVDEGSGVVVEVAGGDVYRAGYVVGCDGGRSVVRKAAGIDFVGVDASTSYLIAEVELSAPVVGPRKEGGGLGPVQPGGPYRVVLVEPELVHTREPTLDDLKAALVRAYGSDFSARNPTWVSRFSDVSRQAATYRKGRLLVAGDAAHVHPPQGGQGLNTGLQDAVNLGWKLAQVVKKISPDSLLDSYTAERHPVGARVLHNTMAQVALALPDERHTALRETMTSLLALDGPRQRIAGMLSALDVHYDLGGAHPLVGRRVPDLDVDTAGGATRLFRLLHAARPLLVVFSGGAFSLAPWGDRVRRVDATTAAPFVLPVIGAVDAPAAVLVRPDGHVAWCGDLDDAALPAALSRWFGPPA